MNLPIQFPAEGLCYIVERNKRVRPFQEIFEPSWQEFDDVSP